MVRYTRFHHTPPSYQPLGCGTIGYITPQQVPAAIGRYTRLLHAYSTWVPSVLPHQGDGAIHQVTSQAHSAHLTQVPDITVRYTSHQVTSHPTQVKVVMVWYTRDTSHPTKEMAGYTRLQNPIDFPEASCTQCTVNTKLHNASVINPIASGGLISMYS